MERNLRVGRSLRHWIGGGIEVRRELPGRAKVRTRGKCRGEIDGEGGKATLSFEKDHMTPPRFQRH